MIPWASPSLLAANPAFEKLHKRLVTDILDHDCTTRQQQQQQQQDQPTAREVTERLTAHRVSRAREQVLAAALFDLALGEDHGEPISKDVREASLAIATYLHQQQQQQQQQPELLLPLLLSDVSTLRNASTSSSSHNNTPGSLSHRVLTQHAALKDIAAMASGGAAAAAAASPTEARLPDLVSRQIRRKQELEAVQLPQARYAVTNGAVALLRAQAEEMERLVRWLEQRRHGAEARYVAGRARWLASVARGMAGKARVGFLEYSRDGDNDCPGWRHRVRQTMASLEAEEVELDRRKKQLTEALAEYGGHDAEDVMRQLGKRYAEIEREIDEVKADIERVSGGGGVSPEWVPQR